MLSKSRRARFVKELGEKRTKALEDMLELVSQAADDAGIEKKELPTSFAELARLESAMNKADGVLKLTDQYQQLITNLANEYVTLIIGTVSEKEKAIMSAKEQKFDLVEHLKKSLTLPASLTGTTKEKAAPPAPAGPSMFAPRYFGVGVPPVHGGQANVTKENTTPDGTVLGNIFAENQSWGKPAQKGGTILDGLFDANQKWAKGE